MIRRKDFLQEKGFGCGLDEGVRVNLEKQEEEGCWGNGVEAEIRRQIRIPDRRGGPTASVFSDFSL